ncbi:TonB-dependent receptor [Oceanidesulfovibrio marinus]|uniref:TonB-dependent receptor n=1 Tax=Oceanidesulfovibrio marinus TaxID=370038 RepID=A0A6P1ZE71_9BACT|nr:TonB-dependent receptor [Oceanidesulfovibrio marinus]QJT10962.1 TonB-dependent receptor [Oceanidesulfovibrio marinus]TVM31420.1 TonB-dependent receptor [Oceanidesulfovibrio marinus]
MIRILFFCFALALLCPGMALAAEEAEKSSNSTHEMESLYLQPVTVTATKRTQKAVDVAASISTVSDVEIEELSAWKLGEVLDILPNVHLKSATSGDSIIIRGLSSYDTSLYTPVGLYVDDVPYPLTYMQNLLFQDIERLEVLRGPQGTLYGKNSEAGVVSIVRKAPDNEFRARVFADYGSYSTVRLGGSVSAPLVKDLFFLKADILRYQTNGYMDNDYKDDDRAGMDETSQGRILARLTPTSEIDLRFGLDVSHTEKNIGFLRYATGKAATGPFTVMSDAEDKAHEDSVNPHMVLKYEGDAVELTSVTSYRDYRYGFVSDLDRTSAFVGYSDMDLDQNDFSQEIRVASPDNETFTWLLGAYAGLNDMDVQMNRIRARSPASVFTETDAQESNYALFGQATYTLFKNLRLTAGLRGEFAHSYGEQTRITGAAAFEAYSKTLDYFELLPMVSLSWDVTSNVTAYGSWSNGFLAGGYNYFSADSLGTFFYDPEHTTNYELGLKTNWFSKKLLANISAFYIDIRDKQVREEDPNGGIGVWKYTNAASAHSIGVELELKARPLPGLELTGGLGYSHAVVDDWTVVNDGVPYSYEGKRLPWSPDLNYHVGAGYTHENGLFGKVDLIGAGLQYFDAENSLSQVGYALFNARVGYAAESWDIALWGKNIFDNRYVTKKVKDNAGDILVEDGAPQSFGVSVSWRF